ncbi:MAG: hypothetical protein HKL95_10285, partial [Phycisphaerae bacterium]|nr:hypothetical protein [Phycisphaerae bacterium]
METKGKELFMHAAFSRTIASATGTALCMALFGLGGCGSHTYGPATALRSPNNFGGSESRLDCSQTTHHLLVVSLPNHPGKPVRVDTVVSVLLPHQPTARPVRPSVITSEPTPVNVIELLLFCFNEPATTRP